MAIINDATFAKLDMLATKFYKVNKREIVDEKCLNCSGMDYARTKNTVWKYVEDFNSAFDGYKSLYKDDFGDNAEVRDLVKKIEEAVSCTMELMGKYKGNYDYRIEVCRMHSKLVSFAVK